MEKTTFNAQPLMEDPAFEPNSLLDGTELLLNHTVNQTDSSQRDETPYQYNFH